LLFNQIQENFLKNKTKLYFAYGMNTNQQQMQQRCPGAKSLGLAKLQHHQLEFRTHATISHSRGHVVEGVLWAITSQDEAALDRLEGYPVYYDKKTITVEHQGQPYQAMTYVMDSSMTLAPPNDYYYQTVSQGYQTFGVSQQQLISAKHHSNKVFRKKFFDSASNYCNHG
jgi:gamma-glutamylcyclotransferase (GGCT)/AIG2-like uncharacterized protein YtfP